MKVDPRFKDTEFVVEADDYARQSLWERYSTQALHPTELNTIRWEQDCMGTCSTIGQIADCPVVVTFFWAKLNGHLICFYHPTSAVVDHRMVNNYLEKYCNPSWDNGRRAHADASNFHHVLDYIRTEAAQQLINEAQAHADEENPDDAAHLIAQCWTKYPYKKDKECQEVNKLIKGMNGHPGAKLTR